MKKTVICLIYVSLLVCAFANEPKKLEDILPEAVVAELKENGKVERTVYRDAYELSLYPRTDFGKEASLMWELSGQTERPVFYYESLFLIDKPNPTGAGDEIEKMSTLFRSISKLEGIQYYSNTRKKYRDLYKLSYTVKSPSDKTRIGDPVMGDADGLSLFALQEDSTFGKFVYRYDYRQSPTDLLVQTANIDAISFIGIKIINPEELKLSILINDLGDKVLMYTAVETDVISLSIIENRLKRSFAARIEALFSWFSSEYTKINAAHIAKE